MNEDDVTYYRQRAEAELEQVQRATRPEAIAAHQQLAEAYLDRVNTGNRSHVAWHG